MTLITEFRTRRQLIQGEQTDSNVDFSLINEKVFHIEGDVWDFSIKTELVKYFSLFCSHLKRTLSYSYKSTQITQITLLKLISKSLNILGLKL